MIEAVGRARVEIKILPLQPYGGVSFKDPVAAFSYLIHEHNKLDFAFVELMKKSPMFPLLPGYLEHDEIALFGKLSTKTLIANTVYTKASSEAELEKGIAQLISYGTLFLANPDLPKRFELDAALNEPDRNTMFYGGTKGYIDYPFWEEN